MPGWLVAGVVYLAGSLALWWHVWTAEPTSTMTCGCGDPASFVWFLAWPKYALTHGQDLFLATRAHVPQGTNLLDNTSVLALGVVLLPVTAAFGPVMALNVALTAAPAASALSAYGCLRRGLGVSRAAAFVGGLAFGFSPYMLRTDAVAHLHLSFLALVPPMLWCVYELAVAQRGRWWRWGLGLGLLAVVQFFIGLEILTITALVTVLALLLAGAATVIWRREALRQPGVVRAWAGFAARGFGLAAAVAGACLAYPLWFALAGPQHIHGADWAAPVANALGRVLLPVPLFYGERADLPRIGYLGPPGTLQGYFGIVALVVLVVAVAVMRRPLVTLCAVMTLASLWLSLGARTIPLAKDGEPSWLWLPWRLFHNWPLLQKVGPGNFSALAVLFTAVAAALLVDQLLPQRPGLSGAGRPEPPASHPAPVRPVRGWMARAWAVPARPLAWAWRVLARPLLGPAARAGGMLVRPARAHPVLAGRAAATAVIVALVVPWLLSWPLPYMTQSVAAPAAVHREVARLPADAVVLFYPFPATYLDQALIWQADQGMRYSIVSGRGISAAPTGAANHGVFPGSAEAMMSALTTSFGPQKRLVLPAKPDFSTILEFRAALRRWGVTTVVMTPGGRAVRYSRRWLATMLGAWPRREGGGVWVWDNVRVLMARK